MKWEELLSIAGNEPVFSSSLLMAGKRSRVDIQLQLARWRAAGRITQLRRGLYVLAEPYRQVLAHPFLLANNMRRPSYVSLQSALAHYGMIPEYVPVVTSVTTSRPENLATPLGQFVFRHIKRSLFTGYRTVEVGHRRSVFVATPEKSLLDLIYLVPRSDSWEYLHELRLQNLDKLDLTRLTALAADSGSPKLKRAAQRIVSIAEEEEYIEL